MLTSRDGQQFASLPLQWASISLLLRQLLPLLMCLTYDIQSKLLVTPNIQQAIVNTVIRYFIKLSSEIWKIRLKIS